MSEDEDMNIPDMEGVAYKIAMEAIVQTYTSLRGLGLSRPDAAIIVAAIVKFGGDVNEDLSNR